MCGIGGIIGKYTKDEIIYLVKSLNYRGPDDRSIFLKQKYGCAFTRLSIIDQKNGNQPFLSRDRNSLIFLNGEIYNSKEISLFLKDKGFNFKTKCDVEPLIYFYESEGISFLNKLNGIFAGCLLDNKKNQVYLFRDRWGVKPLYYGIDSNRLIYSSDIQSIRALFQSDNSYSEKGLNSYLINRFVKAPYTFFKNIYEVLPGELLQINMTNGKIQKKEKYFKLSKEINKASKEYKNYSTKEYEEILNIKLVDAIKKQSNLKNKKGIFLSGGIDSSLLLSIMANISSSKFNTYTLIDKNNKYNKDRNFAKKLSKKLETNHNEIEISPKIWLNNKNKALSAFGQPFSHAFSTIFVSNIMKNNIKVAFSGDGADELFGNYLSHRFASSFDYLQTNKLNKNQLLDCLLVQDKDKFFKFKDLLSLNKFWRYKLYSFSDNKLLSQLFIDYKDKNIDIYKKEINNLVSKSHLDRMLEYELQNELPNQILEFTDKLSMINGIETRVPYLDNEFSQVVLSIPSNLKINHSSSKYLQTKYILKKIASRYLDKDFMNRNQNGFQVNTNFWMRNHLIKDMIDVFMSNVLSKNFNFNKKYFDKIFTNFQNGDNTYIYEIWSLYCLGSWLLIDNKLS